MIDAVIFDKDGTLFDFRSSWGAWTRNLMAELITAGADGEILAAVLGYDPASGGFVPDSPVIAHTTPEIAALLVPHLPGITSEALNARMNVLAATAPMRPAVDLPVILGALRARGLVLGLATNDTEVPARTHLRDAGVLEMFGFVAGCDSGFGGKPAPGQLLAFAQSCGLPPARIAMVGDSVHDLVAARAAGMFGVAVLTGIAEAAELAPYADVVMADIGGLLPWIDGLSRA
jgi:phosphoglycolate phosphatase